MGRLELTVLLDVIADRLLAPTRTRLVHGEDDRLAAATMRLLRRDLSGWRCWSRGWPGSRPRRRPGGVRRRPVPGRPATCRATCARCTCSWRSAPRPPACRADLLLVLMPNCGRPNPHFLA